MEIPHNVVSWFEIPVTDMDRASRFYETVFDFTLSRNKMGPIDMAWFPGVLEGTGAAGSLVFQPDHYKPSADGTLIYLTAFSGDVSIELARVESAGGKVLMPRKQISEEVGYIGLFIDTEGNRIAVHSRK